MKRLITLLLFTLCSHTFAAQFVHPLDFKGTEAEKKAVIEYIVETTKADSSEIGMDDPLMMKMMNEENLRAFKALTKAQNRELLDMVIRDSCSIGMCNYNMLNMMYQQQLQASQSELTW